MSTRIVGISAFFHDSAAALIRDGEIIAAAQEERFTRVKGDAGFPARALEYCLQEDGADPSEIDCVVFYEHPSTKWDRLVGMFTQYAPRGFPLFGEAVPGWVHEKLRLDEVLLEALGPRFRGELLCVGHHESHAASAFFPSPYQQAAILTLDAVGEWATSTIGSGDGNRISLSYEMRFPHSIGMLYSAFTYYTGFKVNSGEYKLMGLAPYGEAKYTDMILDEVVSVGDDGSVEMDMSYFDYCEGLTMTSRRFHELFGGEPRRPEEVIRQKDMDLAASIQKVTEEIVLRAARHAHRETGMDQLVMAGGVALNCVANGRLLREGPFEDVWVQPAAGDAGGALGAALLTWHQHLDGPRSRQPGERDRQKGSFLGPGFDDETIATFLDSIGARYERLDEEALVERVSRLLAEENVVGWFHGRMEYGPRALGRRSILGDPRSPKMQQTMNLKIKFRESFRPFAPCVLREHVHEVFEMRPHEDSPYMLFVAPVRDTWRVDLTEEERERMTDPDLRVRVAVPRSKVPAVTHVDYSARIQTVDEERHGRYYRLMHRFYERTGCPVVVNTSFNVRGEPIVCTPQDAFDCFMATHMDCLVLENFLLLKDDQPEGLGVDAEAHRSRFELD